MTIALFDLDNTLLSGDSDELWIDYLSQRCAVDSKRYRKDYERFRDEYANGKLDIKEYLAFALRPLRRATHKTLLQWRKEFLRSHIIPVISKQARSLIASHKTRGHKCVIVTITNQFVSESIAAELGADALFASVPQMQDNKFTGQVEGLPCYGEGMVLRIEKWLRETKENFENSYFYTDSHNDLMLLCKVDNPIAVNPDPILLQVATENHWPIIDIGKGSSSKTIAAA